MSRDRLLEESKNSRSNCYSFWNSPNLRGYLNFAGLLTYTIKELTAIVAEKSEGFTQYLAGTVPSCIVGIFYLLSFTGPFGPSLVGLCRKTPQAPNELDLKAAKYEKMLADPHVGLSSEMYIELLSMVAECKQKRKHESIDLCINLIYLVLYAIQGAVILMENGNVTEKKTTEQVTITTELIARLVNLMYMCAKAVNWHQSVKSSLPNVQSSFMDELGELAAPSRNRLLEESKSSQSNCYSFWSNPGLRDYLNFAGILTYTIKELTSIVAERSTEFSQYLAGSVPSCITGIFYLLSSTVPFVPNVVGTCRNIQKVPNELDLKLVKYRKMLADPERELSSEVNIELLSMVAECKQKRKHERIDLCINLIYLVLYAIQGAVMLMENGEVTEKATTEQVTTTTEMIGRIITLMYMCAKAVNWHQSGKSPLQTAQAFNVQGSFKHAAREFKDPSALVISVADVEEGTSISEPAFPYIGSPRSPSGMR